MFSSPGHGALDHSLVCSFINSLDKELSMKGSHVAGSTLELGVKDGRPSLWPEVGSETQEPVSGACLGSCKL